MSLITKIINLPILMLLPLLIIMWFPPPMMNLLLKKRVSKSRFFYVDAIESKNINRDSHKTNKHAKAWVKNVFNQW
jgi:hypothetical protein